MRGVRRAVLAGTYPTSKRWSVSSPWDLLPGGHQGKGVNIFSRNWIPGSGFVPGHLGDFWFNWEWSAAGVFGAAGNWILPQLQLAKSIGCNYFRFPATVYGRDPSSGYANTITDDMYFSRWAQVLQWCRDNGMFCYPTLEIDTGVSTSGTYTFNTTNAWRVPEWQHLGRLFQAYLDVVMCVDVMNEGFAWSSGTTDLTYSGPGANNSAIIYNAIKPSFGVIPLTVSTYYHATPNELNPWSNNGGGQRLPVAGVWDCYDAHLYPTSTMSPSDYDGLFQSDGSGKIKPVMMAEFGSALSNGQSNQTAAYSLAVSFATRSANCPHNPGMATATSGGTILAGTYQAVVTYVTANGETVASAATPITTTGSTSTITVTSPPAPLQGTVTGYYAYVTQAGGNTFTRQQTAGSPTAIGTNLTLTAPPTSSGANPLVTDTSGLPTHRIAGAGAWSLVDHDTTVSSDQWGMYDQSGNARSWIVTPFQTLPS